MLQLPAGWIVTVHEISCGSNPSAPARRIKTALPRLASCLDTVTVNSAMSEPGSKTADDNVMPCGPPPEVSQMRPSKLVRITWSQTVFACPGSIVRGSGAISSKVAGVGGLSSRTSQKFMTNHTLVRIAVIAAATLIAHPRGRWDRPRAWPRQLMDARAALAGAKKRLKPVREYGSEPGTEGASTWIVAKNRQFADQDAEHFLHQIVGIRLLERGAPKPGVQERRVQLDDPTPGLGVRAGAQTLQ
jgi:hypothetical protein